MLSTPKIPALSPTSARSRLLEGGDTTLQVTLSRPLSRKVPSTGKIASSTKSSGDSSSRKSPQKRSLTLKGSDDLPNKKHASSYGKNANGSGKSGKDKGVAAEPKTPTGKTSLSTKSGASNDKTNITAASSKSGSSTSSSVSQSSGSQFSESSSLTARGTPRQRQILKTAPTDQRPIPTSWRRMIQTRLS
ncbi:hypothetical protein ABVK25_002140 [Lepraria finkii]|uniref:Uncharacterized protein n=1 Tax=Lepraria finkii TaxID=1340010 RepID=A0ABR4BL62_9LECA